MNPSDTRSILRLSKPREGTVLGQVVAPPDSGR
jgi:hypothetical protein